MTQRRISTRSVEKEVLIASRRRCCLCVFLDGCDRPRRGQIAHLNRDPCDSKFDNLVFLCLDHHDEYDGRTSQSKGLLLEEVREYRNRLYKSYGFQEELAKQADNAAMLESLPSASEYAEFTARYPEKLLRLSRSWRFPLGPTADEPEFFAYKASNGCDGVCLVERVDLPDGRIAIICIQTAGNPGNSITNSVELLCFQVCARFEIPADRLVWIEHYDDGLCDWNMVTFGKIPPEGLFEDPQWIPMTTTMWLDLRMQPKKRLRIRYGRFESKVTKLFPWPPRDSA